MKTAEQRQAKRWREQRLQNIATYEAACHALADAIVTYAADFLRWRADVLARCVGRELGGAATAITEAQAAPLRVSLAEGLSRVPWLDVAAYLRPRQPGPPPVELAPLEQLVEASLAPLRTEFGVPLHPKGEWGAVYHSPLAGECWPSVVHVMETQSYGHEWGIPSRIERHVRKAHPIHRNFRAVSDAAQWIDARAVQEAQKEKVTA